MKKVISAWLTVLLLLSVGATTFANGYTVVTEPMYNLTDNTAERVIKVSKDSKWALADEKGKVITGFSWDAIGEITSSYIPAKKGNYWGYINENGKVLIPYQFLNAGRFEDGIAMAQNMDGTHVYIDTDGTVLFQSPFTYSFSPSGGAICGILDGLYGYCDTEGSMLIAPRFEMAFDFHEGYAAVKSNGKWGFITGDGSFAVKPAFDSAGDMKNGHAVCRLYSGYGIVSANGTKKTSFDFDYIGAPDENGWYPAKRGSVLGYINTKGTWMLKTEYDFCYPFTNGVARVFKDGLWGFIDKNGNELIAPSFIDLGVYKNGIAPFSTDGLLWGFLSLTTTIAPDKTPAISNPSANEGTVPNVPVVQNPAALGERPLTPDSAKCISMKIGSQLALKGLSEERALAAAPVLLDGTTMIPLRDIVELMGGTITWNAENQRIGINCYNLNISMTIGSKISFINGAPTSVPQAPALINGTTMVPLRSIMDGLGCTIKWIDTAQNIYIYYK